MPDTDLKNITESHTRGLTEVGRDLWRSPIATLLLKAGSATVGHSGLCPTICLYLSFTGEGEGGQAVGAAEPDTVLPGVVSPVLNRGAQSPLLTCQRDF